MGLSTKQVSGDHGVDWGQTMIQSGGGALELSKPPLIRRQQQQQQQQPEPLACPRCSSTNTKFCYYNNYNKTQPRHFCKACKRHWTKGGTLRNVPVGGARKNKRLKTSHSNATTTATTTTTTTTTGASKSTTNNNSHAGVQSLPMSLGDQRNSISDVLYQALIRAPSSSSAAAAASSSSSLQRESTINCFRGSSFALPYLNQSLSFPNFATSISTSFDQSSNGTFNYIGGLKSMEDSTITTIMPSSSSPNNIVSQPWNIVSSTGSHMEMPNYWNWDDIDTMVSTDLNVPWDDTDIKP